MVEVKYLIGCLVNEQTGHNHYVDYFHFSGSHNESMLHVLGMEANPGVSSYYYVVLP